jgi:uncharacterized protein (DUF58 family)
VTLRWWIGLVVASLLLLAGLWLGWAIVSALGVAGFTLCATPAATGMPRRAFWRDLSAPVRVVRGDEAEVVIEIEALEGSSTWVSAVELDGRNRVFLPDSARPSRLSWPVDTSQRGLVLSGPARIEAGDPVGLFRRVLVTREASPVLVVPRVHSVEVGAARSPAEADESEDQAGGDTFHSLREYVPGDPPKFIHWKSSARTGKLLVRRMVSTTVPWLLVILDVNARAYDRAGSLFDDFSADAFEDAVDLAASWAWHGCGVQQRVLLCTTSLVDAGPSISGVEVTARTRESALDALALVTPLPGEACGPSAVQALMRRQGIARAVFVTGARRETSTTWIALWGRSCPVQVVGAGG